MLSTCIRVCVHIYIRLTFPLDGSALNVTQQLVTCLHLLYSNLIVKPHFTRQEEIVNVAHLYSCAKITVMLSLITAKISHLQLVSPDLIAVNSVQSKEPITYFIWTSHPEWPEKNGVKTKLLMKEVVSEEQFQKKWTIHANVLITDAISNQRIHLQRSLSCNKFHSWENSAKVIEFWDVALNTCPHDKQHHIVS